MAKKSKRKYIHKLNNKYRLSIYNDQTFEEVWFMRLSRLNVISMVGGVVLLLIVAVTVLIAFTPIREFIPGYPDGTTRRHIVANALKVDSLEHEVQRWRIYLGNLHAIMRGDTPDNMESLPDTSVRYREIDFTRSIEDSLLRAQIEEEEVFNLSLFDSRNTNQGLTSLHLFSPLKGVVTNKFNLHSGHLGVDVVAPPNEVIVSIADGTITFASWTLDTGHVIQVQHSNNLLSVYKHNSKLLKRHGEHVKAGEAIAIIGNSGELTSGPHLHFELWHEGTPFDPQKFVTF